MANAVGFSEEAILAIAEIFESLNLKFLIVGATARDLIANKYNIPISRRRTRDVDFGVLIETWDDIEKIKKAFEQHKEIEKRKSEEREMVRFYYNGTPFDIVPFGGIEKNHQIKWPPFYDTVMTVLGYSESLETADTMIIKNKAVAVVVPELLIGLKFISWNENRSRQKDLNDIFYIMENYEKINPDSYPLILDQHTELLEKVNLDANLTEVLYLGILLKKLCKPETLKTIIDILKLPINIDDIMVALRTNPLIDPDEIPQIEKHRRDKLNALLLALES
ncbi:MAG: nucleotidyl transferase AbiEii/AbiGii toxin family protein [Pseudobdellovibrio sp.]